MRGYNRFQDTICFPKLLINKCICTDILWITLTTTYKDILLQINTDFNRIINGLWFVPLLQYTASLNFRYLINVDDNFLHNNGKDPDNPDTFKGTELCVMGVVN